MIQDLLCIYPGFGVTERMEKIMEKDLLIRDVETKNIMTKSSLPVGGYSVNPYVGCTTAANTAMPLL